MRILGFSKKWDKLQRPVFSTFRYPRVDSDWYVNEQVKVVFQPRRKGGGEVLGIARIIGKVARDLDPYFAKQFIIVTDTEAITDGFLSREDMVKWMKKTYGLDYISLMNKLTLKWIPKDN